MQLLSTGRRKIVVDRQKKSGNVQNNFIFRGNYTMKTKQSKQWKRINLVRQDQLGKGKTRLFSQRIIPNKKGKLLKQTELLEATLEIQRGKTNDNTNKRKID